MDRIKLKSPAPHPYPVDPNRVYRVARLAKLFDVTPTTIWRWRQAGKLPPPDSINGWSEELVKKLRAKGGAS